jgi:hypothetical protein|tara:strand:- start:2393 stop:2833 length:441 start_codon:yes stop_codon:yes gene_type:complete
VNDDYFFKVQQMNEDELLTELQKLNTKLYSFTSETGLRLQIENMINLVSEEHQGRMMQRRVAQDKTPDIIEIGEIEEVVVTPDYSKTELITHFSNFYTGDNISSKQKIKKPVTSTRRTTPPVLLPKDRPLKDVPTTGIGNIPKFGE